MSYLFPSGLGGSAAYDELAASSTLDVGGATVYFVSSDTGDDGFVGTQRTRPFATLGTAVALATDGTLIVLMAGHEETVASQLLLTSPGITIVGEGRSGGKPSVRLSFATDAGIAIQAEGISLRNVLLAVRHEDGGSTPTVTIDGNGFHMANCHVENGVGDVTEAIYGYDDSLCTGNPGGHYAFFENCVFEGKYLASEAATAGLGAKRVFNFDDCDHVTMIGCVIDGGETGFADDNGLSSSFYVSECSLTHGGSVHTFGDGWLSFPTVTGGGMVRTT